MKINLFTAFLFFLLLLGNPIIYGSSLTITNKTDLTLKSDGVLNLECITSTSSLGAGGACPDSKTPVSEFMQIDRYPAPSSIKTKTWPDPNKFMKGPDQVPTQYNFTAVKGGEESKVNLKIDKNCYSSHYAFAVAGKQYAISIDCMIGSQGSKDYRIIIHGVEDLVKR